MTTAHPLCHRAHRVPACQTHKRGRNQARKKGLIRICSRLPAAFCCVIMAQVHLLHKVLRACGERSNRQTAHTEGKWRKESCICPSVENEWRATTPFSPSFPPPPPFPIPSPFRDHIIGYLLPPSCTVRCLLVTNKKGTTYLDGSQGCPPGCTCFCFHLP